jgi:hypothetical protein
VLCYRVLGISPKNVCTQFIVDTLPHTCMPVNDSSPLIPFSGFSDACTVQVEWFDGEKRAIWLDSIGSVNPDGFFKTRVSGFDV